MKITLQKSALLLTTILTGSVLLPFSAQAQMHSAQTNDQNRNPAITRDMNQDATSDDTMVAPVGSTTMGGSTNSIMAPTTDPDSHADKDMKKVLDALASLHPKPIETLTAEQARLQPTPTDAVHAVMKQQGKNPDDDMGVRTKDITIPINGQSEPARIYYPKAANKDKALPIVVYYHGGGFVIADIKTYDAGPRALAKATDAIFISVEYRHAPENKFPAAHDDAFAAYQWVLANAASLGGDPKRVAVMGESAGGNLAINVSIAARDQNIQMPIYEVLVYPVAGVDMTTPSYQDNATAKPLNKAMMTWFVQNLITSPADLQDPRLDLVGKANLTGLPPTTVITDQIDPLRSEGKTLADKLQAAGVKTDYKNYDGVTHEFFGMGAVVSKAKDAESRVAKDLKGSF